MCEVLLQSVRGAGHSVCICEMWMTSLSRAADVDYPRRGPELVPDAHHSPRSHPLRGCNYLATEINAVELSFNTHHFKTEWRLPQAQLMVLFNTSPCCPPSTPHPTPRFQINPRKKRACDDVSNRILRFCHCHTAAINSQRLYYFLKHCAPSPLSRSQRRHLYITTLV